MHRHAPEGNDCPFCIIAAGGESERNAAADVVLREAATTAFVSPTWWASSPGHVIVVPNDHFENLYEVPDVLLGAVYVTASRIARAMQRATAATASRRGSTTSRVQAKTCGTSTSTSSRGAMTTTSTYGTAM